jgi:adenylate cyclase
LPGRVALTQWSGTQRVRQISAAVTVGWLCSALLILHFFPWPFELLDLRIYDLKLSFSPDNTPNHSLVHVDVDDKAIEKFGPWPWDRALSARIVQQLTALGAKGVALDIIYSTKGKSAEGDEEFAKAMQQCGNVISGVSPIEVDRKVHTIEVDSDRIRADLLHDRSWPLKVPKSFELFHVRTLRNSGLSLPQFMTASHFLGHIKSTPDRDGVFRRVPLFLKVADRVVPSLGLAALAASLGVTPDGIQLGDSGHIEVNHNSSRLRIPVDSHANLLIRWRPTWKGFDHFSVLDLLSEAPDPARAGRYKDKIAIVDVAWTGTADRGINPLEREFFLSRLHSAALDTMLSGRFLYAVNPFPSVVLSGAVIAILFGFVGVRLSLRRQIAFFFGIVALAGAAVTTVFFVLSREIPVAGALFAFVPSAVLVMAFRAYANDRERELVRNTFGRYVCDEVVEEILNSESGINVKGELKEATFLVSDLRGFTPMTESLPPMVTVDIANRYLEKMAAVIVSHRGTINEFLGDGILVFFGVPRGEADHTRRALACALEMQAAMEDVNLEQRRLGLPELRMGIGINTGVAVVGTIGSEDRKKYTAMGSALNVTFRVEGQTKAGEILVTPSVYHRVERDLVIDGSREAQLKGIALPLTLYNVVGLRDEGQGDTAGNDPKS